MLELTTLMQQFKTADSSTTRKALAAFLNKQNIETRLAGVTVHCKIPLSGKYYQADIKVVGVDDIIEVARGASIHRSRESACSSCNRTMVPLDSESIVVEGNEFRLWADKFLKVHVKPSTVAVFLGIHGLGFDAPATFGIHITCDPQVHVVIKSKVIA